MDPIATRITHTADLLGESPVWDPDRQTLFWVDSVRKLIRSHSPSTGEFGYLEMPSMVGSIGLATEGRLVAGLADGIYLIDVETGEARALFRPEPPNPLVRFNDGKVDRQGRFVCGTMGIHADPLGVLYRLNGAGETRMLADGICISNALCFSLDGGTMYFADSMEQRVRAYDYSPRESAPDALRTFAETSAFESAPDGATVDSEDYVWVALVRAGKIARFSPSGDVDRVIDAPADLPSCVAFGGPDMETLFVTTIKDSGTGRAVSRHPDGGHLFAIDGLGVKGVPEPRFSGISGD